MHSSFHQMIILFLFCITFAYSTELPETRLLCTEHEIGVYDDLKETNHEIININVYVPSIDWLPNDCKRLERTRNIAKRSLKLKHLTKIWKFGKKFYKRKVGDKRFEKVLSAGKTVTEFLENSSSEEEEEESYSQKDAFQNILNGGGIEHLQILEPKLFEIFHKEFDLKMNFLNAAKSKIIDLRCSGNYGDSKLVVTLKIPIFEIVNVKKCFDLGEITDNLYRHYEFPWTAQQLFENYNVHLSKCEIDELGDAICPKSAFVRTKCVPNSLEMCILHSNPLDESIVRVYRTLSVGMVVYGDVEKVLISENGITIPKSYETNPFQLYYITAKNSETIEFGDLKVAGKNGNKAAEIRHVGKSIDE